MAENMNIEVDDDMMAMAEGGLNSGSVDAPRFSIGDTVSYRACDEAGNKGYKIAHIIDVGSRDDGWGYEYTVDTQDAPISENSLILV